MSAGASSRADRREAWFMGIVSAAMLILPLAGWGAVRVVPAAFEWLLDGHSDGGCSLETNAVGSCRSYCSAQVMYHRNDWDGDGDLEHASPPSLLYDQRDADGQAIQLMDQAFALAAVPGGPPKHGYIFQEMQTIAGQPIDWKSDYALCATPAVYGRTGYRTFIVCTNGTTFGKDLGRSAFVSDYPADPAAEGWIVAE
jgi:hypothetical protein